MPTQKLKNRNIRKLTRVGKKSLSVTLPIDLIGQLKWKDKQKVVVKKKGGSLVIRDWKK
jgi:antitoxin component of MazEF toxin-antitoxin module